MCIQLICTKLLIFFYLTCFMLYCNLPCIQLLNLILESQHVYSLSRYRFRVGLKIQWFRLPSDPRGRRRGARSWTPFISGCQVVTYDSIWLIKRLSLTEELILVESVAAVSWVIWLWSHYHNINMIWWKNNLKI